MKNLVVLTAVLFSSFFTITAQCKRSGTFIPDSPNLSTYPIEGSANVTIDENGAMSVNFESDFKSVQGFLLQVYLSKTQSIDTENANATTFIRVDQQGDLRCDPHGSTKRSHNEEPMTGAKSFTENLTDVDIEDYDYVILQCVEFNVPWGYAKLGDVIGADCQQILSVTKNDLEEVSVFPNPAHDFLNIENPFVSNAGNTYF